MKIKQFKDDALAHFSYAIVSKQKMAVVDPARDPKQYYKFAEENNAQIVAIFETHPHADFVSSHYQMHKETGATIYASEKLGADYPHQGFDDGASFKMGDVEFSAINTPGHSPDSISIIADDGKEKAAFTGDTLFIGNVGRPDLREKAGNMRAKREELAQQMYHTMQNKYTDLPDETLVYPAHGAGSLCGKNMSDASSSTLGQERMSNWAFQKQSEEEFVEELLKDQPMIPHYFGFDVDTNKAGAENYAKSIGAVPVLINVDNLEKEYLVVDIRDEEEFKQNHLENSINIMGVKDGHKLETWLGAIVKPEEKFYVVVPSVNDMEKILGRIAKIGYEKNIKAIVTLTGNLQKDAELDLEAFKNNKDAYTIVDIRNAPEVEEGKIFDDAIAIPLHELRERTDEIPTDKPLVVHCAGGYRSAAGSSILDNKLDKKVYDLSDAIKQFK